MAGATGTLFDGQVVIPWLPAGCSSIEVQLKVLFVHPGPLLYTNVFLRLEPLGLELVAQSARHAGHACRLIDLQVESHADYHRLVGEWRPDFIAFSCNYLANVPEIVDLAKATKQTMPRVFICVGGHSASFTASAIVEHGSGAIDCVSKHLVLSGQRLCDRIAQILASFTYDKPA